MPGLLDLDNADLKGISYILHCIESQITNKEKVSKWLVRLGIPGIETPKNLDFLLGILVQSKLIHKDIKTNIKEDGGELYLMAEIKTKKKIIREGIKAINEELRWQKGGSDFFVWHDLKLDTITGKVRYNKTYTKFSGKQLKLLELLLSEKTVDYKKIGATLWPGKELREKLLQQDIGYILQHIKEKLDITGKTRDNPEIFEGTNKNYRLI